MRAAASSMASAMPSRRRQISVTAAASSGRRARSRGCTAWARSTNSSTAGDVGPGPRRRAAAPATRCSAARPQPLAAGGQDPRRWRPGSGSRRRVRGRVDRTCSQLSSTSSSRRPDRAATMLSVTVSRRSGRDPQDGRHGVGHRRGIADRWPARRPRPRRGTRGSARRRPAPTSRVLPTPPTPVRVTSRWARTSSPTSFTSTSRPTKLVDLHRQVPRRGVQRPQRRERRSQPVARTWNRRTDAARSRSRCSPRSSRSTPLTSAAAESLTTIWPPWPAAITRAARFRAGPK